MADEFKNVIRNEGHCGHANSGSYHYLVNTDSSARYRVTVRTYWKRGINSGHSDQPYEIEAGGRKNLGCSDNGFSGGSFEEYKREVVGEVRI